jgi:hypothetical protein
MSATYGIELDCELFFGWSCFGDVVGSVSRSPIVLTCNWIDNLAPLLL